MVGHFVSFMGQGCGLSLSERATIANMSPEFGSTCAFFAVDEETLRYLRTTGQDRTEVTGLQNTHVARIVASARAGGSCIFETYVDLGT